MKEKDYEFLTPGDGAQMLGAVIDVDEFIQKARDLVNKYGHCVYTEEEMDSFMRHTAQLFRINRVAHMRAFDIAGRVSNCKHCNYTKSHHRGKDKHCPFRCGYEPVTTFELRRVRYDELQKRRSA